MTRLKTMADEIPEVTALCVEMSEILFDYYLLKRVNPDSDDALENMKTNRFGGLLIDDIILSLCKFREDDTRNVSFEQALKAWRKRAESAAYVDGVVDEIKSYRQITKNLDGHRQARIAHLAKRGGAHLKPTTEMRDAIVLALKIVDTFSGVATSYHVLDVDVRADL